MHDRLYLHDLDRVALYLFIFNWIVPLCMIHIMNYYSYHVIFVHVFLFFSLHCLALFTVYFLGSLIYCFLMYFEYELT